MVSTYPPMKCGIGKYAYQMVKKLQESGNVVNVLSPEEGDGDYICNLRGNFNLLRILKYGILYNKIIFQYHPSLYYDDIVKRNYLSILATHLSFSLVFLIFKDKVEIVMHEFSNNSSFKMNHVLERIKWKLCPKLIFHTETEFKDFELQYFALPAGRYELRPPNAFYYKFRDISKGKARSELGVPGNKLVFLCIGFIQPHKGFDRAIRAFSKKSSEKMKLYVVGSLRIEWGEYTAYLLGLKQMAEKTSNVHVVEKYLSDEEFDTWISASDVVVVPYKEIWSSAVLGRAKLFDKPVIAADVGGLSKQASEKDIMFEDENELEFIFDSFARYIEK
jgi:glycosyltransferase involved in cell wall biosynthesis